MGLFDVFTRSPSDPAATGDLPPQPDPLDVEPRAGRLPIGGSGRAHWSGFIAPDELNPELVGVRGLWTFDDMYFSDPHMRRLILMLASTIQGGTWGMEAFGGDGATQLDKEVKDKVWWWLNSFMRPNLHEHIAEALPVTFRNGFCPFEQIWSVSRTNPFSETLTLPSKLALRLPRTVMQWPQDQNEDLAGIVQMLPTSDSVLIPASELVYYRVQAEGDNWQGRSLLRQAFKPYFYKNRLEGIEAIGLERKAVGFPVMYPPVNAKKDTKDKTEIALANAHTGEASYMIAPGPHQQYDHDNGWFLDVIRFDSSAGAEISAAIDRHQDAIAASILGDFMSLGHHQVGARATAEVQEDPFLTVITSIITPLIAPLNRLIARVVHANWPAAKGAPELTCSVADTASLSEIATFIQLLVSVNAMQVDPELEDALRERAQLPVANGILRKFGFEAQVARLQAQTAGAGQPAVPGQVEGTQEAADGPPGNDQPENLPGQTAAAGPGKTTTPRPTGGDTPQKASARQTLDQPTPDTKWVEKLIEAKQLTQALTQAKQCVTQATQPAVSAACSRVAVAAADGQHVSSSPPGDLTDAFERAFMQLYAAGRDSVMTELGRQHTHLQTGRTVTLMTASTEHTAGAAAGVVGVRALRVRARADIAARALMSQITSTADRSMAGGVTGIPGLQAALGRAASTQLAMETSASAMDLINAGRFDVADANSADIAQATYTSALDGNTCEECAAEDGSVYSTVDEAVQAVPNGDCAGGPERCRCTVAFQLSDDPRAYTNFV